VPGPASKLHFLQLWLSRLPLVVGDLCLQTFLAFLESFEWLPQIGISVSFSLAVEILYRGTGNTAIRLWVAKYWAVQHRNLSISILPILFNTYFYHSIDMLSRIQMILLLAMHVVKGHSDDPEFV
jgi:hypothetical protein